MKKINSIYLLLIVALLLNGCFSLDQEPYDETKATNTFNTPKEVRFWLNNIYIATIIKVKLCTSPTFKPII